MLVKALLLTAALLLGPASSSKVRIPKWYNVDLDQPPEQRWKQVAVDFKDGILNLRKEIKAILPPGAEAVVSILGEDVEKYIPYPYNMELFGIVDSIEGLTVGDLILGNVLYEVTAFGHNGEPEATACTSIVAEALNGSIFHGRNLDYGFGSVLRDLTINVNFQRGGKTLYMGTTFAGMVGLLSGQKLYGYTITLDERNQGDWWMNALESLVAGTHGVAAFLIRDTLDDPTMNFDDAVRNLAYKPLIAPSYIIVGGIKSREGAVITRDRIAAVDLWLIDASSGRWYLVETNYDHWKPPPASDNRRDPAIKAMNAMTRGGINLYSVLSTPPVLNNNTVYTVLMCASIPYTYASFVRIP